MNDVVVLEPNLICEFYDVRKRRFWMSLVFPRVRVRRAFGGYDHLEFTLRIAL